MNSINNVAKSQIHIFKCEGGVRETLLVKRFMPDVVINGCLNYQKK